jgi:diguanylate cyclase (GGDEF)-like protein
MVRLFHAIEGLRMLLSEREQHTERLKILSETDGLTGLVNRRLFDRIGQGEAEFNTLSREVSVIMMDLDRFKGINDSYGHLAGDQVLKRAAAIVQRVCRKTDVAARYGGEEIAIIVFESDPWVAMHVAERIRVELEVEPIVLADGRSIRATASFGVAHGKRGAAQWLTLVKAADGALYDAKEMGRNRVCRAPINPLKPKRSVA